MTKYDKIKTKLGIRVTQQKPKYNCAREISVTLKLT
jgi:hypothetical protein